MRAFGGYVLLESLGAGAMGDVHLARPIDRESALPTPLVVKRLHPEMAAYEQMVKRFKHEAELAVRIDSPHVAKVFDAGRAGDTLYLAMEFIPGWSFAEVIERSRAQGRHLPLAGVLAMIRDVALGLSQLHGVVDRASGTSLDIVHRDLSPRNLMLGEDGVAKIIDLGIGRSNLRDWKTQTGALIGSPGYVSPEQAAGTELGQASDLYTLGVVFWELATMRALIPYGQPLEMMIAAGRVDVRPVREHRSDAPPALDVLIAKMLAKDPAERPSARAVVEAIDAIELPRGKQPNAANMIPQLFGDAAAERAKKRAALLADEQWMTMVDPTEVVTLARRTVSKPKPAPRPAASPPPPARKPSRSILLVLPLAAAVAALAALSLKREAPPGEDPPPPATAGARPLPRAVALPAPEPRRPPPVEAPAPVAEKRRPKISPAREEREAPAAQAPEVVDPDAHLVAMIDRARALRKRIGDAQAVDALLTELLVERARSKEGRSEAQLQKLEDQLRKLEATSP